MTETTRPTTAHKPIPEGNLGAAGLLLASLSVAIAVAMHFMGLLRGINAWIIRFLTEHFLHGETPAQLSIVISVFVTLLLCFGIVYAVLDSRQMWRRFLLGVTALVVLLGAIPTLAIWGIYLPIGMPLVGLIWAWVCALLYTSGHRMPCDAIS